MNCSGWSEGDQPGVMGLEPNEKKIPNNHEENFSFSENTALPPQGQLEDSQPEFFGSKFYKALQGDPKRDGLVWP